jgi:hypothetical protein
MRQQRRESDKKRHAWEKRQRERNRKHMASYERKENMVRWDFSTIKGRLTYINSHLTACQRCGTSDYRVLSFHHRDPKTKRWNVKEMAQRQGFSKKMIDEEIAKCDILCLNCHSLTHWEWRRGIKRVDDDHKDSG